MFASFQSGSAPDTFRTNPGRTSVVTLPRLAEDADATGAPALFPVRETCPDPMPQADGCP